MANGFSRIKTFSGPWTIYRRKQDAFLWERFELACIAREESPSVVLYKLAEHWVTNKKPLI